MNANTSAVSKQESHPEAVWVAPVDGTEPPRRMFELASASTSATTGGPEHIVDLVWMPDGSRLVAITRQAGPPARARVVLLTIPGREAADAQPAPSELVLWRSTDGGQRWQRWLVTRGPNVLPLAISPDYPIDETVFVGVGGRVMKPLRAAQEVRAGADY